MQQQAGGAERSDPGLPEAVAAVSEATMEAPGASDVIEALSTPVFAGLTMVDRAKLAAALEARHVPAGAVVFDAGHAADALYILRSGTAERRVNGTPVGTIEAPEMFGLLGLLSDEPRSASIVALTPLSLWALPRARFRALLKTDPGLLGRLTATISRRFAQSRAQLGELRHDVDAWVERLVAPLSPAERRTLLCAALLDRADPSSVAEVAGADPGGVAADLADLDARTGLVERQEREYRLPPGVRDSVLRVLGSSEQAGLAAFQRRAADVRARAGDHVGAVRAYLAADAPDEARRAYEAASEADRALLGEVVPAAWGGRASTAPAPAGTKPRGGPSWKVWVAIVAAMLPLLGWVLPAPTGLSLEGWRALLVIVAGAVLLAVDVIPDAIVVLLMAAGWVVPGTVAPAVALGGFAQPSWFLVIAVLAVGAAVGTTGLLYRAALLVLLRAPERFAWRAVLLGLVGAVITPTLPNATSRTALAAPIVRELAEALGYAPASRAAAGLSMAAFVGFSQLAALFLTGSSVGLLIYGIFPPELQERFTFARWFLGALPPHVLLFALGIGAALLLYRPEAETPGGMRRLALQKAVLGPTTRAEWLALVALVGMVAGFLTEPIHRVDAAWVGIAAMVVLVLGGVLTGDMLRTGVNWNFLLFFGIVTSLSAVFRTLGIDRWLGEVLAGPVGLVAGAPMLFVGGLALLGMAISFVVRWQAAAPLLTLVATPVAEAAGVSMFVVAIIALVACQGFFFPFQSTTYLALYHGSGELYTHTQVRRFALLWAPIVLVSLVAAVPAWQAMGLIAR